MGSGSGFGAVVSRGAGSSPGAASRAGGPSAGACPAGALSGGVAVSGGGSPPFFAFATLPARNRPLFCTAEEIALARARRAAAWVSAPDRSCSAIEIISSRNDTFPRAGRRS